jgi:hypothetical protein
MISLSKSGYSHLHPDNAAIFNATVADAEGQRLWWGDLDLTRDEKSLVTLARRIGINLFVYYEGDSRFVERIDPGTAVAVAHPDGRLTLGDRTPLTRNGRGRIVRDRSEHVETTESEGRDHAQS